MKKFNCILPKFIVLFALLAFSCSGSAKKTEVAGGGTSEETNALTESGMLSFEKPNSYVASAEDGAKFSAATAFEISTWVKIDSLPQKSGLPHNLIGKFYADSSSLPAEFSLAILNGACGTAVPTFAFFLTDETDEFSCDHAILSKKPVIADKWTFVEVKWDGHYLTLYQDGSAVATEEKIIAALPFSNLPVYLGKSKVPFAINKFSLNAKLSLNSEAL